MDPDQTTVEAVEAQVAQALEEAAALGHEEGGVVGGGAARKSILSLKGTERLLEALKTLADDDERTEEKIKQPRGTEHKVVLSAEPRRDEPSSCASHEPAYQASPRPPLVAH